jgi:hypothetical protein
MHAASATMPTFMTCASICPNPAERPRCPAPSGMRTPADRITGGHLRSSVRARRKTGYSRASTVRRESRRPPFGGATNRSGMEAFDTIGTFMMAAHSKSVSSYRMIRSSGWALESRRNRRFQRQSRTTGISETRQGQNRLDPTTPTHPSLAHSRYVVYERPFPS